MSERLIRLIAPHIHAHRREPRRGVLLALIAVLGMAMAVWGLR